MAIVGLLDEAVKENRERVFSAIKNAGLIYPRRALTVNLAPASVRKEGPALFRHKSYLLQDVGGSLGCLDINLIRCSNAIDFILWGK